MNETGWAEITTSSITAETLRDHPDLFALEGDLWPIWELFP